mmetsp:Transcript_4942/g.7471  ORF Transcript_4942/g.7471 Transcript_4942/m.7471 type:complete len:80 (+) Transcript_4942:360-599(+)
MVAAETKTPFHPTIAANTSSSFGAPMVELPNWSVRKKLRVCGPCPKTTTPKSAATTAQKSSAIDFANAKLREDTPHTPM